MYFLISDSSLKVWSEKHLAFFKMHYKIWNSRKIFIEILDIDNILLRINLIIIRKPVVWVYNCHDFVKGHLL